MRIDSFTEKTAIENIRCTTLAESGHVRIGEIESRGRDTSRAVVGEYAHEHPAVEAVLLKGNFWSYELHRA